MKSKFIEHTEDLYQNAPCGYLTMLADGEIVNINNTLLFWLGYKRDEVLYKKRFPDLLGIGGKMYYETHMMPLLQMQEKVKEINMELRGSEKRVVPVLINGIKVQAQAGETFYRLSIIDITQRKQYEKELLKARKEAEETNKRLREINEELEHFAYTASHDLQAPLNNIGSVISLIERKKLLPKGEEGDELFSIIASNTQRMRTMIHDLLEYSKLDGKIGELVHISLRETSFLAMEMLNEEISKNGAKFTIEELPIIHGNKSQITRLFLNLFSNAIKYRKAEPPQIHVSFKEERNFFTVFVQDNGTGFEQKYDKKIFNFMERLHSHDEIAGTGIGLSACKRIVDKHGGSIGVSSVPGEGSTFYFTLPKNLDTASS
ncbi:sensor histidine kinase [Anditalea andensis]|uniref:histidine kinase n=1 Tax=Anditalea andensis TaxID=1048983 RepID=A0A074L0W9_9BACT|nr:ATP-binding protein [Anditalea andensis]KEO74809.1 histidine kinase [Anditalea andensis]